MQRARVPARVVLQFRSSWPGSRAWCSTAPSPEASPREEAAPSTDDAQRQLLEAALKHVPRLGWTEAALQAAAGEQGLSPAVVGILPRGAGSLAEFYVARCNQQLKADLAAMTPQLASMRVTQRVHTAVRKRLEMLAPHIDSWPQALALLAAPASAPHAAALLFELVDDIWYASGDTSHDYSWYSKRALLAGVYVSTELYMLTDFSPGYADTWEALERRLADVLTLGRLTASMGTGVQSVLEAGMAALASAGRGQQQGAAGWQQPAAGAHMQQQATQAQALDAQGQAPDAGRPAEADAAASAEAAAAGGGQASSVSAGGGRQEGVA